MDIRKTILEHFNEILVEYQLTLKEPLQDDTVLLKTGVDSLGFATLVARLEETLNYDPFVLMEEPVYPRTFGEFVAIYEKFKEHANDDVARSTQLV